MRAFGEISDGLLDLREAHSLGMSQDRDDEPLTAANGNANMKIVAINDVGPITDLGIESRRLFQSLDYGFHEERHETQFDFELLQKPLAVFLSQLDDRGHVDFVK